MSWHASAIFIAESEPSDFAVLLDEIGFPNEVATGETIDFEEATSYLVDGRSVAHVDGWTIICDSIFFAEAGSQETDDAPAQIGLWPPSLDAALRAKSANQGRAFGFLLEGASDTHGFTWYEDGKLRRAFLHQEDRILFDEGDPLPVEAEIDEPDEEQWILILMQKLCVEFAKIDALEFQVLESK